MNYFIYFTSKYLLILLPYIFFKFCSTEILQHCYSYLLLVDVQDSFKGKLFKVKSIAFIIISAYSLGVMVDNNLV